MAESPQKLKVFLCHASENKPTVQELYDQLTVSGFDPWLDSKFLLPGMNWDLEIKKAMRSSDAVIVCLSKISVEKEGYVQKEIKYALEIQQEKLDDAIFLLPIQIEKCDIPFSLEDVQWGKYYEPEGYEKIVKALTIRATKLGRTIEKITEPTYALPIGSHIPFPRNVLFTGREKELDGLADSLLGKKPSATLISQAIIGMGGIGKTQLAVEFAYRYGYRFKSAHWLDLRDPSGLDGEIAKNGSMMNLRPWSEKQPEQVQQTLQAWQADGPRLLILDNFEDVSKSNEVFKYFQHPSLRVLVTSRRKDFPKSSGLQIQEINLFTEQESFDFLQKTLDKNETHEEKKRLAEKLGNLPLALELAVSYININNILTSDYIGQLDNLITHESMQNDWFKELDITSPTKHDLSLLGTFQLSWQEVKDELQQKIFIISGYCAPNTPIPLEIFKESPEQDNKELHKALYRLSSLGLLRTIDEKPSIHPLLADYARYLDKEKKILSALTQSLVDIVKKRSLDVDRSGNYSIFTPLLPHIQLVAENADMANIQGAGYLWNDLGYHVSALANFTEAKIFHERALLIDEANFGPNHTDVARDVSNLGAVLQDLGDYVGAKTMYERALLIDETTFGPDHPDVARDVSNLGTVLQDLGEYAGAKTMFERALPIYIKTKGKIHSETAEIFNNLGASIVNLGNYSLAMNYFKQASNIMRQTLPRNHPLRKQTEANLQTAIRLSKNPFILQQNKRRRH